MRKKHHTHRDERIVKVEVSDLLAIEQFETCAYRGVPTRLGTTQNRCRLEMEWTCLEIKKSWKPCWCVIQGKQKKKIEETRAGFLMWICIFYCQKRWCRRVDGFNTPMCLWRWRGDVTLWERGGVSMEWERGGSFNGVPLRACWCSCTRVAAVAVDLVDLVADHPEVLIWLGLQMKSLSLSLSLSLSHTHTHTHKHKHNNTTTQWVVVSVV